MGFLSAIFRRSSQIGAATPENPRFGLNDPAAWDAFGVTRASSGIPINREVALTYSPWWRGINLVSNDVAKLPLHIYQRVGQDDPDGAGCGKEKALDHPAYLLLRRKPNERMTAYQWKRLMVSHAMSTGNGYSVIQRRGDGQPVELLPLDPEITYPVMENGRQLYITDVAGDQRKILPENMFHLHGLGFDGIQGYSVWQKARDALGLGMGSKRYATVTLRNMGRPATILTHPLKLADKTKDALLSGWARMHEGIDNAGRTAILDGGLDAKEMAFNPEDMQMLGVMEISVRDIANFLGLAPHKLGDTSRTAYSSLEQENQSYLDEGLDPWLVNFEDECHDKLLSEEEKADDSIVVEFLRQALQRADLAARTNYYKAALGGQPWMAVNEVREQMGENPLDGNDEIKAPLNMGGAQSDKGGDNNEPKPPLPAPPPDKKALRSACTLAVADVVGRMVRRVGAHAERAAARGGGKAFIEFVDGFEAEHQAVVRESCKPVEALVAALSADGRPTERELAGWLLASMGGHWAKVAETVPEKNLIHVVVPSVPALETELTAQALKLFLGEV